MKTVRITLVTVFLVCLLPGCGQTATQPIRPGDKIGDFLITTGKAEEVKFMYELDESNTPSHETEVEIPWGTKIVSTYGIYDDSYSGKLEESWAEKVYQLEINHRPVNLEAFGTIEKKHPIVGTMRFYNVVIEAARPGTITVRHFGKVGGTDLDETITMNFLPSGK